jgi:hypothetical protein
VSLYKKVSFFGLQGYGLFPSFGIRKQETNDVCNFFSMNLRKGPAIHQLINSLSLSRFTGNVAVKIFVLSGV